RVVAQRGFNGQRRLRRPTRLDDALDIQAQKLSNHFDAGQLARFRLNLTLGAHDPRQQLDRVHRQSDRSALVSQRARHRLANPPVDICAEAEAAPPVVLVSADLQADVAFLDEIEEAETAVQIASGDRYDQAQVALDEVAPGV